MKFKNYVVLMLVVILCITTPIIAKESNALPKNMERTVKIALDETTNYLLKTVKEPQFGSVGGEWAVFGLARRGVSVPKNYYEKYYQQVGGIAKEEHHKTSRNWKTKVTETQRLAIAVTAIGKDATNIKGVNLIDYSFNKGKNMPSLTKDDKILGNRQGINELIFGLITIDLRGTSTPKDAAITRDGIIEKMLKEYQVKDGGFSLTKNQNQLDVDMTAMAIGALAPYYNNAKYPGVKKAVDKALSALSKVQTSTGGFKNPSIESKKEQVNLESTAQVIVALSSLGINPTTDKRFIKNNNNPITDLMRYYVKGGGFEHVKGGGLNQMATEQGYYALVAYERLLQGKNPIYDMRDVKLR